MDEEYNHELESSPPLLNLEELHVEQQSNPVNAMFKIALLIVLWPHGDHGQSVTRHAEVVLLKEPELFKDHLPTEEFHVVQLSNVNNATQPHAQLTVLWELGRPGQNVANHAVLEFNHEQEVL